jgi:hypothetical protein
MLSANKSNTRAAFELLADKSRQFNYAALAASVPDGLFDFAEARMRLTQTLSI